MVALATKEILLQWRVIVRGEEKEKSNTIKKLLGEEITIGREEDNTVAFPSSFMFISRKHGKIKVSSNFFGIVSSVVYEDTSKYGTGYLPPGVSDISKAIQIHRKSVAIASGCKLLFLDTNGEKNGISMVVLF